MDNVLRPTFGRPAKGEPANARPKTVSGFSPIRVYGKTMGHFVALMRGETGDEGITLQVIVGQEGGESAESVAIIPDNADGEAVAEVVAFAILRTLEMVSDSMVGTSPA